jgi:hypothetical protein
MLSKWHVDLHMVTSGQFFLSRFGQLLTVKFLCTVIIIVGLFFVAPKRVNLVRYNFLVGIAVILLSVLLMR